MKGWFVGNRLIGRLEQWKSKVKGACKQEEQMKNEVWSMNEYRIKTAGLVEDDDRSSEQREK